MTSPIECRGASPRLRILSLGAGVQSSALLLLACEHRIPPFDFAIFADTGWESQAVYRQLDTLRQHAETARIPLLTVSRGNVRDDALDPRHGFVSMPLHILKQDGTRTLARRQCTNEYKIRPIKEKIRALLGYPHPRRVPRDVFVEQAIGISTDEFHRAKDADVRYLHNVFPLITLGWSRSDCRRYLSERGLGETVKSACIGCPFRGNQSWRDMRDHDPDGWEDAIAFDAALRQDTSRVDDGRRFDGQFYLHRSCLPLWEVNLDRTGSSKSYEEKADPDGCSPWSCRSGVAVDDERAA